MSKENARGMQDDMISRQAAIDAAKDWYDGLICGSFKGLKKRLEALPSTQPEVRPIDYQDCSNAMLKMWMDNIVTDGEYNRIMDKLNAHWGKRDE